MEKNKWTIRTINDLPNILRPYLPKWDILERSEAKSHDPQDMYNQLDMVYPDANGRSYYGSEQVDRIRSIVSVDTLGRVREYYSDVEFYNFRLNNDQSWNFEDKYDYVVFNYFTYSIVFSGINNIDYTIRGIRGLIK